MKYVITVVEHPSEISGQYVEETFKGFFAYNAKLEEAQVFNSIEEVLNAVTLRGHKDDAVRFGIVPVEVIPPERQSVMRLI